jgi:predicted MFS family arabinose efflux permease
VFFVLACLFAVAATGLIFELITNPQTRVRRAAPAAASAGGGWQGFVADYAAVLSNAFARIIIVVAFIEGALMWGAFAYIGAYLHQEFGVSFTLVGVTVACFGVGGLIYAGLVKLLVRGLGQIGLAIGGGLILAAAYTGLAVTPVWRLAPIATVAIGLGFYMLHNTLQTNATLMTPHARGTAVGLFSSALYIGQTVGVAAGALAYDRIGAAPLFLGTAAALLILAIWFAAVLRRQRTLG